MSNCLDSSRNFKSINWSYINVPSRHGERGGSVVECRTPEREVRGSRPTAAVLCPWARHFTPRKYWLITQEAMAPSRHDWKIVDWDVKPQHNQPSRHTVCLNRSRVLINESQYQVSLDMRNPILCHMRTTKAQISLCIRAVWSAPLLFID